MKVLVTGGAGFIGSHTVDALLRSGAEVRVLDNLSPVVHGDDVAGHFPASDAELVVGDVRDRRSWELSLRGVDAVVHLAAYQDLRRDFSTFFDVNVVGTALLYEVAVERGIELERVVVASSQAVLGEGRYRCGNTLCRGYGLDVYPALRSREQLEAGMWNHLCAACGLPLEPLPTAVEHANPRNQYALSKYSQERVALELGAQYGVPTVALRYSIVQGPRQSVHNKYSGVCRIFCISHFAGRDLAVFEDGEQQRDFVNIDDVVAANVLVLGEPRAVGTAFNVGGPRPYTILEFARIVQAELDSRSRIAVVGRYRFGDTRHIVSDSAALQSLGWRPIVSPDVSVREYAEWFSSAYHESVRAGSDLHVTR